MSETKNRPGPKTKASRGERRYIKRSISLPPNVYDYILNQQRDNELFIHTIVRLIIEHRYFLYVGVEEWLEEQEDEKV